MTKSKEKEPIEILTRGCDDRVNRSRSRRLASRIFWGLFFLVAAVAVSCQIFGILTFEINIWWIILGIFLVAIAIKSLFSLNWLGVFLPTAVIITILNYQTDLLSLSGQAIGGTYAVAVLLSIAFYILFHSRKQSWSKCIGIGDADFRRSRETIDSEDSSEVAVDTHFSSAIKYVSSNDFRKATIDCSFGAVKIFFDNATPSRDGAIIDVDCSFGAVEMYIPKNWNIQNDLDTSFGGIEEKNRAVLTDNSPVVRLIGDSNFGGVTIIYV